MEAASAMAQNSSFEDEGAPEGEGGGASAVFQSLSKQLSKAKELEERSEAQLAGLETEAAALGATTDANGLAFGEPWTAQMRSAWRRRQRPLGPPPMPMDSPLGNRGRRR